MRRPDKLRVLTPGDGPASEFYYDGKTMVAFEPAASLVAVADAPPTIDAALKAAYDTAAIYFPFTDVIVADPYKGLVDGLKHAFYIGQSRVVGGTTTDMVAIVNNWVFEQIWIGADDKLPPLVPRSAWLPVRLWPRPTLPPPRRVPTLRATLLARPTPCMLWAQFMRRSQLAAPYPRSTAQPTTTAVQHGSSHPTAPTVSTTVWC
jgi:hypothetical protein